MAWATPNQCMDLSIHSLPDGMKLAGPVFTFVGLREPVCRQALEENVYDNFAISDDFYPGCLIAINLEKDDIIGHGTRCWPTASAIAACPGSTEVAFPMIAARARKGKNIPTCFVAPIGNRLIYIIAVWKTRKATPESLMQQDDKWVLPTTYPDCKSLTMETIFHMLTEHLELQVG